MWALFACHDDVISPQSFGPFARGSDAAACKYVIQLQKGWVASLFELHACDSVDQVLAAALARTDDVEWLRGKGF